MSALPTPRVFDTFASRDAALRAAGYAPGTPEGVSHATRSIDRWAAARRRCPCCRNTGMAFKPYRNRNSYRGLAVCGCGYCQEV